MVTTIIESLVDYFSNCPLMSNGRLNIDYLPEDTGQAGVEYAIGASPTDEVIQRYRDGGARCRYPFTLSSINDYGADVVQNMLNTGFYEKLANWLTTQSRLRNLPELPCNMQTRSIRAIGTGYLFRPDVNAGNYQIQCELEYYKKGDI